MSLNIYTVAACALFQPTRPLAVQSARFVADGRPLHRRGSPTPTKVFISLYETPGRIFVKVLDNTC